MPYTPSPSTPQVLKQEGPAALFTGLAPTLWRNCIWNGLYYGTAHELDKCARRGWHGLISLSTRSPRLTEPGPAYDDQCAPAYKGPTPLAPPLSTSRAMPELSNPWAAAGRQLAVGTGVGIMATCFNAPFDVVKSRCVVRVAWCLHACVCASVRA